MGAGIKPTIMTNREYDMEIKAIEDAAHQKKRNLIKEFCDANNPYKIGDIFSDHIGQIRIEKIKYYARAVDYPCCIYEGIILNKNGDENKLGSRREAYQINETRQILPDSKQK